MSSPAGFHVEPDQIHAHAGTVGDIADGLSNVAGAPSNGLTENALGPFVQFLTTALQDAANQAMQSVTHASSAMGDVGQGLRKTAESYQGVDQDNAAGLSSEGSQ